MKKVLAILFILILLTPMFPGVNKNNAVLGTWQLDFDSNYQTWQDIDLSSYTSNKLGKVLLHCEILSGDEATPSEWVSLKFRSKGETLVETVGTMCFYGTRIGAVEVWTDDDGVIQWYSDYGWPENKTVVLQIKIMININ
jgi:hypothetical protein